MSKKNRITIAREDDFAEVDTELAKAMEMLDGANERVESLLREQKQPESDTDTAATTDDEQKTSEEA